MFSYTPVYPQFPTYKEDEDTAANAKPVTQTIKTDPATGEQTMTISGSVQDLSAANPLTPTVTGPAVPQNLQPTGFAPQPVQMPEMPQPGEPVQVAGPMQISAEDQRRRDGQRLQILSNELANTAARLEQTQDPAQRERLMADQAALQREIQGTQRGMGIQPTSYQAPAAAPAPLPENPVARQFAQQAPLGQTQAAPAPQAQPAMAAPAAPAAPVAQAPAPAQTWFNQIQNIQGDEGKLAAYYGNEQNDPAGREFARTLLIEQMNRGRNKNDAKQKVEDAVRTGDMMPLMREIKKSSEEGSYIKAYLYNRLGLTELAKEEQQKLGAGTKFQTVIGPDGKNQALIQFDANGLPKKGFDQAGQELKPEDLARYAAGAMQTKAHLLPSVHGTPVKNAQGEMGLMMYDPRTQQSYVQVGNERRSAQGWTTMAQSAVDVYTAAAAGQLGRQAAQTTGAGQVTPSYPGVGAPSPVAPSAVPAPATTAPVTPTAITPPAAALTPAAAPTGPTAPTAPTPVPPAQAAAPQTPAPQRVGAGVTVSAGKITPSLPQQPGESFIAYQERLKRESAVQQAQAVAPVEVGVAQAKENIQVAGARSQSFNKILDEEVRPQAQAGDTVSSVRKQQFALFDRPGIDINKIFGLYNAAQENPSDQKLSIVRDIFGGIFKPEAEVSQRLAQLNLTPQEKAALAEYNISNQLINAATLKRTAGAGSVSDAEQKANREANVDPTKVPALGAYNAMAQSQFDADKSRWKADWALNSRATNALELDKEWRQESARLTKIYADIAKKRAEFIAKNGADTNAVREGYRKFPVPEYDAENNRWIKTKPLSEILGR